MTSTPSIPATDIEGKMQDHLPTISLFKPKKSCNRTVMKKELISYVSDLHEYHVTDAGPEQVVRFRISGEQMCDLRNSFFTFELKTNAWTSMLPPTIGTAGLVSKLVIRLPHSGNQIIESIDSYHTLATCMSLCTVSPAQRDAKWHHGCITDKAKARGYLNANSGGYRLFHLNLTASGIFQNETMLPLMLLNGVQVEITLEKPTRALIYDREQETKFGADGTGVDLGVDKDGLEYLSKNHKDETLAAVAAYYDRPLPVKPGDPLSYTIRGFKLEIMSYWMNEAYVSAILSETKGKGFSLYFDTFWHQIWDRNGSTTQSLALSEQYQNLRYVLWGTRHIPYEDDPRAQYDTVFPYVQDWHFRQGSRIYETIYNDDPRSASSYTRVQLALDRYSRTLPCSITHSTFNKSKNVQIFDFQKCQSTSVSSGIDTTLGKVISLNVNWNNRPGLGKSGETLTENLGAAKQGETVDVWIVPPLNPANARLFTFSCFTRLVHISQAGVAISQ